MYEHLLEHETKDGGFIKVEFTYEIISGRIEELEIINALTYDKEDNLIENNDKEIERLIINYIEGKMYE